MSQTRACCNHGWGRWRLTRGAYDFNLTMLDLAARAKPCKALRIMCEGCMKRHIRLFTQCAACSTRSCPMRTTDYRGLGIDAVDNASGHDSHEQRDTPSQEASTRHHVLGLTLEMHHPQRFGPSWRIQPIEIDATSMERSFDGPGTFAEHVSAAG